MFRVELNTETHCPIDAIDAIYVIYTINALLSFKRPIIRKDSLVLISIH